MHTTLLQTDIKVLLLINYMKKDEKYVAEQTDQDVECESLIA